MSKTVAQIKAELAALTAEKQRLKDMDKFQNEGGEGYSAYEEKAEQIARQEYALEKELFAIEWTPELTAERRAIWNAEMQKLVAAKQQATTKTLNEIAARIGFGLSDLKRAIQINSL